MPRCWSLHATPPPLFLPSPPRLWKKKRFQWCVGRDHHESHSGRKAARVFFSPTLNSEDVGLTECTIAEFTGCVQGRHVTHLMIVRSMSVMAFRRNEV